MLHSLEERSPLVKCATYAESNHNGYVDGMALKGPWMIMKSEYQTAGFPPLPSLFFSGSAIIISYCILD